MRITRDHYPVALLGLGAVLILGCSDSTGPAATTTGALEIMVSTSSASVDVDPDGYTLSIDGGSGQAVAVDATLTILALPTGRHLARLDGLAPNCTINGNNPRWVYVGTDKAPALPVSFSVSCLPKTDTGRGGGWDY